MISPIKIVDFPGSTMAGLKETTMAGAMNPGKLWQQFMPLLKTTTITRDDDKLYAVQEFHTSPLATQITRETEVTFWTAIRIDPDIRELPDPIVKFVIPAGCYAVFIHRGPASEISGTMRSIYQSWLPASGFVPDNRMHLQVMASDYKGHLHPEAEEEIWIPVGRKQGVDLN